MKNNKVLFGLATVALILGLIILGTKPTLPKLNKEIVKTVSPVLPLNNRLNNATVMVSNRQKTSGGSGVILYSDNAGSYILTNSHVCGILETSGGLVSTNKGDYVVERFMRSQVHDICAIYILQNLEINTKVANSVAYGERIYVSGYPFLLPNTITDGYLSNSLEITLLIDVVECTDKELEDNFLMCLAFGGMPIIKNYTAQTVSAMSAPGNSGSGVYNNNGEIVGLLFAGIGRSVSHGLIVPLEYVKLFLNEEVRTLTWKQSNSAKRGSEIVKTNRSSNITNIISNENLDNVKFPAVKSDKFEIAFDALELWKKTQKTLELLK